MQTSLMQKIEQIKQGKCLILINLNFNSHEIEIKLQIFPEKHKACYLKY